MGMERGTGDFFLYSRLSNPIGGQFRLRGDTGQVELGMAVSHPISTNQLNITAGRDSTPIVALDGLGISTNGLQSSINLTQRGNNTATRRTAVTFGTPTSGF